MRPLSIYYLFHFLLVSSVGYGQVIQGKVVDSETSEVLPFTNVFLNNTTIGTVTDINGVFNLISIKEPGSYELVFSFVGYESYKRKVIVDKETLQLGTIKLIPSIIQLNTVEVAGTPDKEWRKKFKKIFLGEDKFAVNCTILNPWVIDFPEDTVEKKFLVKANAPIEIVNDALGYKVYYYLTDFWSQKEDYLINGNIRFEEINASNESQALNWAKNRDKAFRNSYNYFF